MNSLIGVRSQLDSSHEISEDLSLESAIGKWSFELHLDAILLHGDVTDLVDLDAHGQVLSIEGVKRLVAQQLLRDRRADLLQPLGIASAQALHLDAVGARLD